MATVTRPPTVPMAAPTLLSFLTHEPAKLSPTSRPLHTPFLLLKCFSTHPPVACFSAPLALSWNVPFLRTLASQVLCQSSPHPV